MAEQLFDCSRIERVKHQHACARQKRRVQLERRVFGGGADQHHGAVLHHRQEGILLRAVEAVHLVDKEQRALSHLAPRAGRIERLLQIGDAGEDRGDLLEMQLGGVSQEPRHGGLAGARRAPEDQRAERARLQHPRQRAVGAEDMILADDVGQFARAQTIRQRMRRVLLKARGCEQRCAGAALAWSLRAHPPSVTLICWPPRNSVMRHSRDWSRVTLSRSPVLEIFLLFTARIMSPFWKPTLAAVESSGSSVTTTPSVSASRCNSSATAGEMLATVAPWNGERPASVISSRSRSGAVSSATESFRALPPRITSIWDDPPNGWVAKR